MRLVCNCSLFMFADVKQSDESIADSLPQCNTVNGFKYLHKKFKKMAAILTDDVVPTSVATGKTDVADQPVHISVAQPVCSPAAKSPPHSHDLATVAAASTAVNATSTQSSLPECTRTDVLAGTKLNNCAIGASSVNQNCVTAQTKPLTAFSAQPLFCNTRTTTVASLVSAASPVIGTDAVTATTAVTTAVAPSGSEEDVAGVPAIIGRYACPYCKLVCNKPSVLQKHIRAHTNERPYPCLPCGFAFKTRSNLYKHCRSRSHSLKLEEVGVDSKMYNLEEEVDEDDDDQQQQHIVKEGADESINEEKVEQPRKSIYKPKFHKAAIYIQNNVTTASMSSKNEKEMTMNSLNKLGLQIKIPTVTTVQSSRSTPSTPSPFSGSSPSPEFLQRHISKLISENQAIVETTDPFWSKKFYQRSKEGSPSSPLSTSSSSSNSELKKKIIVDVIDEKLSIDSKLAHALLHPRSAKSVSMNDISNAEDTQPLNLTISKDVIKSKSLEKVDDKWEAEVRTSVIESRQKPVHFQVSLHTSVIYQNFYFFISAVLCRVPQDIYFHN